MATANEGAVKYAELTDEHNTDIKQGIELYVKSEEYWDKFAHHSSVPRGHKTFTSRRLIQPRVKPEDVKPRAELIAPRPHKFSVMTFSKTVNNYGDKAYYTKEDLQYHFDETLNNLRFTLQEIAIQKLDIIKGKAFINSRAIISYDTSITKTLDNAAMVFRKNKVKRWANGRYLAHVTPEMLTTIRAELEARKEILTEAKKGEIEGVDTAIGTWRDWVFSLCTSELVYKDNGTKQILVLQGRRAIDGEPGVDVAKLEGESNIDVFDNGLGHGILEDEDGKLTTDDNKQMGSVAINMDGLGSAVSDDLAILNCELTLAEVSGTVLNNSELTGYVSQSPASTIAFSAVAAADGTAIASPTVTLKEKSSSGTAVTATNGKYPVVPGNKYYYSVAKTNYATVAGTFIANAGDNTFIVALAASN